VISSTKEGARARRNRTRAAITTAAVLVTAAAFAGPAQADLTASPDRTIIPHYPDFVQDGLGQQAALCVSNLGAACGPDAASIADMTDPGVDGDAEGFYWSGATTADVGDGDVTVAFDVEAATVGPSDLTPVAPGDFQRVQVQGDANLPNGTYTLVTPFGTVRATKTADNADGRWFRVDTAGITTGPIDHFLTQVGAPAGFYGDATPAATEDGATVSVYLPGHNPADIDPVTLLPIPADGIATQWEIIGALVGNPITLPPADNDKDGVPDASDNCPAAPGPASNGGCPVATPPAGGGTTGGGTGAAAGANTTTTIVQLVPGPAGAVLGTQSSSRLSVSRLTLARRISVSRLRARGLRGTMNVQQGTNVVRFGVYKARGNSKTGRALYTASRTPTHAGLFRFSLRSSKLSKLKAGRYVLEVRAGRSAASLGAVKKIVFTVTR
jgi:hypothetical protein